jgi:hypothetical protein
VALGPVRQLDLETLVQMAARLQKAVSPPLVLDATQIYVTCSIGFCMAGRTSEPTGRALYDAAVVAVDAAWQSGPGAIRSYAPDMGKVAADRDAELDAELEDYTTSTHACTEPAVRRGFAMAMRRFARGTALPQPTLVAPAPVVSSTVELSPENNSFWVKLAGDGLVTDWFVVKVGLELPVSELRGESLLHIRLPGLPVAAVRLEPPPGTGPIWRPSFLFPFHRGFLAARSIDRFGIGLLRDGETLLWPGRRAVRIDVLAARAAT